MRDSVNPADSVPAAETAMPGKRLGVYPQKQDGLFFQRIPLPGGRLSTAQLAAVAAMARDVTASTPLHLTTRQDLELHNIAACDRVAVQQRLQAIGLPTAGAGGDSVRNITVCPCCGFDPAAFDVFPLAGRIGAALAATGLPEDLPRKFKISLAGCAAPQSKPYINDLAFTAVSATTLRVIGAGSLGPKPATGIVLAEALPVAAAPGFAVAALAFFAAAGDRDNRRTARFRHIRQRLGDTVFRARLAGFVDRVGPTAAPGPSALAPGRSDLPHRLRLQTVRGDLTVEQAQQLADAAAAQGAQLCVNLHHGIDVFSRAAFDLPPALQTLTGRPVIVACPGSTTCRNGLTDCPALAEELSRRLTGHPACRGKTIGISGCPNRCAHSSVADIGLSGGLKTVDGRRQEVYQVTVGGGNGATGTLGTVVETIPAADLPARLAAYLASLD